MSGYLQRIVAAAARPERRIRPFVGSIYAPSQASLAEEDIGATFSETIARPAQREAERLAAVEPGAARRPNADAPAERRTAHEAEAIAAAAPSPLSRSLASAADSAPQPMPPRAEVAITDRTRLVEHWRETAPEPATAAVGLDRPRPGPGPLARAAPQLSRPRAEPPRDPGEDVQIHIGRIEVIAPQPAPAQPAAPRAPRSTSLQDYLKRGARRAR
jgi:hypothetical protein